MRPREGFTLVEMLVAMAITLFIMVIITTAFTTGLETFRGLKGIGDMQQSLRTATQRLRSDLQADHFDAKKRLSDPLFMTTSRPIEGFFHITQQTPGVAEGLDLDNLDSVRAVDHLLHFSVNLRGNRPGDFFTANVPPPPPWSPLDSDPANPNKVATNFFNQPPDARFQQKQSYSSQWAEVAYYMERTGSTNDPTDPAQTLGTPLYSLYRVQRLLVPDNSNVNNLIPDANLPAYADLSCQSDGTAAPKLYFNTPKDVGSIDTNQRKRAFSVTVRKLGSSLILTNVVSFRIQVMRPGATSFSNLSLYDTTGFHFVGNQPVRVPRDPLAAVQITLRVWDEVTLQARQITIIQDM